MCQSCTELGLYMGAFGGMAIWALADHILICLWLHFYASRFDYVLLFASTLTYYSKCMESMNGGRMALLCTPLVSLFPKHIWPALVIGTFMVTARVYPTVQQWTKSRVPLLGSARKELLYESWKLFWFTYTSATIFLAYVSPLDGWKLVYLCLKTGLFYEISLCLTRFGLLFLNQYLQRWINNRRHIIGGLSLSYQNFGLISLDHLLSYVAVNYPITICWEGGENLAAARQMLSVFHIVRSPMISFWTRITSSYIKQHEERSSYCYVGVQEMSFRLLEILPGNSEQTLQCKLVETNFRSRLPYEAISYTWNDHRLSEHLLIDDQVLNVTESAYSALKQFRFATEPRYVWIDSICIDQQNIVEKGSQIAIMNLIYQHSTRVLIYLETESDDARLAMDLVNHLWDCFSLREYKITPRSDEKWTALFRLLHHRWFERIWVMQEIAMAPSAVVIYGNQALGWSKLAFVLERLCNSESQENAREEMRQLAQTYGDFDVNVGENMLKALWQDVDQKCSPSRAKILTRAEISRIKRELPSEMRHIRNINTMKSFQNALAKVEAQTLQNDGLSQFRTSAMAPSLAVLLRRFALCRSTEPKDKVFGLISMSEEATLAQNPLQINSPVPISPDSMSLDYEAAAQQTFTEVALKILTNDASSQPMPLHVLPFAGIHKASLNEGLPSWVPDWSNPPAARTLSFDRGDSDNYRASGECSTFRYNQMAATPAYLHLLGVPNTVAQSYAQPGSDPLSLVVQGLEIDHVQFLTSKPFIPFDTVISSIDLRENMQSCIEWQEDALILAKSHAQDSFKTQSELTLAFRLTLVGGRNAKERCVSEVSEDEYIAQIHLYKNCLCDWEVFTETEVLDSQFTDFAIAMRNASGHRRFCITKKGRLALVPPETEINDLVFILLGAQVPFILRDCDLQEIQRNYHPSLTAEVWDKWCGGDMQYFRPTIKSTDEKKSYQVVGECYVHGAMYGEVMDETLLQEIVLR